MRILYINDVLIDIDDTTAIGIDLQAYDIKDPAKNKVKVSNTFTIPITNNNLNAVGFIGGVRNTSTVIYDEGTCNYYVNNTQFINNSKIRVLQIADRISLYVFEKDSIWDILKGVDWGDFVFDYYYWLDIPKDGTEFSGTFDEFISQYIIDGGDGKICLPYLHGNDTENVDTMILGKQISFERFGGGHFCSFFKPVFEYIEETYGVDFNTGTTFTGNIFDDTVFNSEYWVYRDLTINTVPGFEGSQWVFTRNIDVTLDSSSYYNSFEAEETRDKSLYDFVIAIFQKYNITITEEADSFRLKRFDYMANEDLEVIDFSGGFTGVPIYKPFVDGYNQNNYIRFKNFDTAIQNNVNQKIITCQNKNIESQNTLFEIDGYVPSFITIGSSSDELIPDLSTKESFSNFKFFINDGAYTSNVTISWEFFGTTYSAVKSGLFKAALYSLDSEYTVLNEALQYPVFYEAKKWMNSTEVYNLDFFRQYFIRELGGAYFINKIKGFNPDLSRQATTLELLKISDRTPVSEYEVNDYWIDGQDNIFTDGLGNKYY